VVKSSDQPQWVVLVVAGPDFGCRELLSDSRGHLFDAEAFAGVVAYEDEGDVSRSCFKAIVKGRFARQQRIAAGVRCGTDK